MARWIYEEVDQREVDKVSHEYGIPKLAAEIIVRRKIEDVEGFLYPSRESVRDPFLLTDMEKAVDILVSSWKKKERVLIHGDYDVDGITGAALLYTFMKKMGWKVDVYIPDRMNEGYGVSPQAIEEFAKNGGSVLLTVDCGTTAVEEVELAKSLGLKVVITDHHEVKEKLPEADAVVNPHKEGDPYPFKDLAGVGVAFKLVQALADRFGMEFEDLEELLDLVAVGTVADMVPLVEENRFYVKKGLKLVGKIKRRPGLKLLVKSLGISKVRSRDVSFKIAPRLNAAGRMGSAMDAFRLVVAESEEEAREMLEKITGHNRVRQETESSVFKEAVEMVERENLKGNSVIVVAGENWHVGVIGIVASRLANKYGKPAMVISFSDGVGKGSARSVNGTNIYELFQRFSDSFIEFGGHAMAVGFTIDRSDYERIRKVMKDVELEVGEKVINVDAEIEPTDINPELFEVIDIFEPFGLGNPPLIFLMRDLEIRKVSFFDGGASASLLLRKNKRNIGAIWMGVDEDFATMVRQGAVKMDVLCEIEPDFISPKIKIVDARFKSDVEEIDSIVDLRTRKRIDREEMMIGKRKGMFGGEIDGTAYFYDIRTRNSILLHLLGKVKFVFCCGLLKRHVLESLRRHVDVDENDFLTIEEFLERGEEADYVIVEPQILTRLRGVELVEEFIREIRRVRKIGIGVKFQKEETKKLLKDMGFRKYKTRLKKNLKVVIQDQRGKGLSISSKSFVIVSREPEKFSDLTSGQYYSSDLNRFQRASMVNLVKRGAIKKFSTVPSTDGLPTFIPGNEIYFASQPLTLYELIDSVYPVLEEREFVLIFSYEEKDPELEGLDKIYYEEITSRVLENPREILRHLQDPGEIV